MTNDTWRLIPKRSRWSELTLKVEMRLFAVQERLIGKEGERWFKEKVKTAFGRRNEIRHSL